MSQARKSFDPSYFDRLYADQGDPWNLASSAYEHAKYKVTILTLGQRRFSRALEVGCSIGILTEQLASRCDWLLGVDIAQAAINRARDRCAAYSHVYLQRMQVPREWPVGEFDLIVFSEVLYFLDPTDIARIAARSISSVTPRGLILLVHWTGETDYPTGGNEAVDHYLAACGDVISRLVQRRESQYRVDLLVRR